MAKRKSIDSAPLGITMVRKWVAGRDWLEAAYARDV